MKIKKYIRVVQILSKYADIKNYSVYNSDFHRITVLQSCQSVGMTRFQAIR